MGAKVANIRNLSEELALALGAPDVAHILIAGATGSGKTELMRSIIASLAMTSPFKLCPCMPHERE